jgi:hypothetical protein
MRQRILDMLKGLEKVYPPKDKCHHALTYAQYGSDETGWSEELALQVSVKEGFICFFLDDNDMDKSVDEFISDILSLINKPLEGAQISGEQFSYTPKDPA